MAARQRGRPIARSGGKTPAACVSKVDATGTAIAVCTTGGQVVTLLQN